ncbi:hypothetical protein CFC21_040575 [Triticum aestivum]|uniref:Uncharacterized protein n=2 Tax=Triticum aestivum TaxID=4565 RepID=A0A9R1JT51_WHEAT|nr:protein RALF-like 9 [Triticum dicoccoides]XP_044347938.1 protein RALF-like 9 [Triticum aestivum]KAF7028706.1 hypothetical protein CFC21_040575 [Triticum aestivum]CDM82196.1 unnamed protein product [Triticum aestivum]
MGKVSMQQLALVALVLASLVLSAQEADGARPESTGGVISYRALVRGNSANTSDANVRPSAVANPYTRGCSKINRCRG